MNRFIVSTLLAGVPALISSPLIGQVVTVEGPLPIDIEAEVIDRLNEPGSLRFSGSARLPAGTTIQGDVSILAGSLDLGGTITGRVLVVNGDAVFQPSASVGGPVVVVGGIVVGEDEADLAGGATAYAGPLRYQVRDGRILPVASAEGGGLIGSDLGFGSARLSVLAGPAYNRVEGLPVRLGGVIQTPSRNPLSLEAYATWRSVAGVSLNSDKLGYSFRLSQGVGGRGTAEVGATAFDENAAIESQGMSDLEASLSTFFFRQDPRDYYQRRGWSVFARLRPGRPPIDATLAFRVEDARTGAVQNPWTVRDQDAAWRPLPLVAEGGSRSLGMTVRWDSRDDPSFPADGWLLSASFEQQLSGALRLPPSGPLGGEPIDPPDAGFEEPDRLPHFSRASVDLRHYARIGPTMRLGLRATAEGSVNGHPLPPQRQIALGGEGSLPGHRRFSLDCGARETIRLARTGDADEGRSIASNFHAYGCDRAVLFQAELEGELPISGNPLPDGWQDSEFAPFFHLQPTWSVFVNAAQGWEAGGLGNELDRRDSPTRLDAGVGLFVGPFGVYWAIPLNERERDFNFFVRLQHRF